MNWIKQINNKVEERWINSSYEFKCNLSEIFFLGIFAVWLILTYSWTTMAHIPWPPFFYFCVQIGIGLVVLFRYMVMKTSDIKKILFILLVVGSFIIARRYSKSISDRRNSDDNLYDDCRIYRSYHEFGLP